MHKVGYLCIAALIGLGASCKTKPADDVRSNRDKLSFEEFVLQHVYKEPFRGGVYIVDGDTPIPTLDGVKTYYRTAYLSGGELIVHQAGGADAAWSDQQKVALTYCISDNFGSNKDTIVEAFAEATENGWELHGKVDFVYVPEEDANCNASNQNVVFDVRQISGQSYLARAFFPDQSRSSRNILVDTSSFSPTLSWPLSGIMAHELGHTLGFRHEHTRPESGASQCFEDNNWRSLTPYDSTSVMHYPQCNGTGPPLTISSADKAGIAELYGPAGPPVCGDGTCSGETCEDCPEDCGACPECGNGTCEKGEDCASCEGDCGACPECGDGVCNGDETCGSCEGDCGECVCGHDLCETGDALEVGCDPCVDEICAADPFCCNNSWDSVCVDEVTSICGRSCEPEPTCGDGTCNGGETCADCEADCGPCEFCGDGTCNAGETCDSCADDCGACEVCGDGTCNADETCDTCADDCGACEFCGDGTCNADETCDSCADDCGACEFCGDGTCNADETCDSCADDCGACNTCGDGECTDDEDCSLCSADCGVCESECSHALCETGGTLEASCDSCAASICAVDPYCCETAWDSICVGEVGSVCEQSCLGASCVHSICETGSKLPETCDACVTDICAVDPYCCNTSWDSICVGEVDTVCGLECS